MSEKKQDFDRLAKHYTVEKQMDGVEKECKELGVDVRDTFHVVGTTQEGDKTILHIVTSGEDGKESARRILNDVGKADSVVVENTSTERYNDIVDDKFITKVINEELERLEQKKSM